MRSMMRKCLVLSLAIVVLAGFEQPALHLRNGSQAALAAHELGTQVIVHGAPRLAGLTSS